jgi:hypothetical protein
MAFNGIGYFSIAAGQSFRLDGWSWPDGGDRGAQYFSAHPLEPNGKLVMTEQNKTQGSDGRTYYGFRVKNEGPNDVHFSVQGGGFINPFEIENGSGFIVFGNHEDHGAQFCSASPVDRDVKLVMTFQSKARLHADQIGYGYGFVEEPARTGVNFRVEGGGFTNGFNGIGAFTIESGTTVRFDGWTWPDGADHGAQYFSAHPDNELDGMVITEQTKMLGGDGRYYYGFTVTNRLVPGPIPGGAVNGYSVQGGGFV